MTEEDFTREATQLLRAIGLKDPDSLNFFQGDGSMTREDWKAALKKPSPTRPTRRVSSNDTKVPQYSSSGMRRVTVADAPFNSHQQPPAPPSINQHHHRLDYKRTSSAGQALTNGGTSAKGYTRTASNTSTSHPTSAVSNKPSSYGSRQDDRNPSTAAAATDRKVTTVQYRRRASAEKPNVNGVQPSSQVLPSSSSSSSRRHSLKEARQQESKPRSIQNGYHKSTSTDVVPRQQQQQQQPESSTVSGSPRRNSKQPSKKSAPNPPRNDSKTKVLHEKKPSFQFINISTTSSTRIAQMVQDGRVTEKRKPHELTLKPQNQNDHQHHHHHYEQAEVKFTVGDGLYDRLSPSTEPATHPLTQKDTTANVYDRLTPREIAEIMKSAAEAEEQQQQPSKYQQPLKTNFPPSTSRRSSSSSTTSASSELPTTPVVVNEGRKRPRHYRSSSDNPPVNVSQQYATQATTGRLSADANRSSSLPSRHGRGSSASLRSNESDSDRNFRSPLSSDVTLSSPETRGTPDSSERSSRLEVSFSRDALDSSMSEIATSTVQALSTLVEVITPTIQTEKKFWYDNGFDDDDSSIPLSPVSSNFSPTGVTSPMSPVSPGGQTCLTTATSPISHTSTASSNIYEANRSQSTSLRNSTIFEDNEDFFGFCARCGHAVVGVESGCCALDNIYHTDCFSCARCKTSLMGKNFYTLGPYVICEKDFLKTLERCYACKQRIQNRVLRAFGRSYHAECFKCAVCGCCLDGLPHASDTSHRIYCISDFQKMFAPKCSVCSLPIAPQKGGGAKSLRVVAMDQSYHVDCYKCESCGKQLASKSAGTGGEKCYPLDGHLLCKPCHTHTALRSSSSSGSGRARTVL